MNWILTSARLTPPCSLFSSSPQALTASARTVRQASNTGNLSLILPLLRGSQLVAQPIPVCGALEVMKAALLAIAVASGLLAPAASAAGRCGSAPWCDTRLPADERAGLLLGALTREEKIALLAGDG